MDAAQSGVREVDPLHVMAGLDPAIHVFDANQESKTWMPATSAGMTAQHVARIEL